METNEPKQYAGTKDYVCYVLYMLNDDFLSADWNEPGPKGLMVFYEHPDKWVFNISDATYHSEDDAKAMAEEYSESYKANIRYLRVLCRPLRGIVRVCNPAL